MVAWKAPLWRSSGLEGSRPCKEGQRRELAAAAPEQRQSYSRATPEPPEQAGTRPKQPEGEQAGSMFTTIYNNRGPDQNMTDRRPDKGAPARHRAPEYIEKPNEFDDFMLKMLILRRDFEGRMRKV